MFIFKLLKTKKLTVMPRITYLFTTCSLEKEIYHCHFKELLEQEPRYTSFLRIVKLRK